VQRTAASDQRSS